MKVHIKIVGFYGMSSANEALCLRDGITIKDITQALSEQNELFRSGLERKLIIIMRNGISIEYLQGLGTEVRDGDNLLIMPMQFGG